MGEVFAGRYELADPIGRGGVGAVWRAWDHRRRRYVAAKVLQQSDAHSLLRFVREQALRIDHPHVLAPASWAADDDKVLFTMDLVAGGSLVHLIADYGPLPPAFVCTLIDQLLSGLAAVHAEGVVHRDIKPANVLLEATGTGRPRLRLSDFGIAMRLGEPRLTETDYVVGTPGYFAPEQMLGADPDFPSDLFAVGLVALYLLEGAKPDSKALIEYFAAHGTPGAPKGIPEPLWQVVATLLQPDPQARFRTATGARKALAQAAELLPEPGPDDELIEIFDQLGPLPKGFAATGPLKPSPGVTTSGARAGTATGRTDTGTGRVEPDGTHTGMDTGPGAARRYDPYRGPKSGGTPTGPATGGTRTGPGPRPMPGPLPGPMPDPVPAPGTVSPPSGPGTGPVPARPVKDPTPSNTGFGAEQPWPSSGAAPIWPGADSVPGGPSRPDGTGASEQGPQASPAPPTYPAHPAQRNSAPAQPDAPPPRPPHPPAVVPPQPSAMSDTGSFHLPPPHVTVPSGPPQHGQSHQRPAQPSTPPTAVPLPAPGAAHVLPPFEVPSFGTQPFEPAHAASLQPPAPRTATQTPTVTATPTPTLRQDTYGSSSSYAARSPQVALSPQAVPQHRGRRRQRRPGPPAKVAIPVLFLALACYAVGFWALFRI
ncbi:serine/threonine-protein kinase [Streptomyces lacrimifluminis]|uniref:non-specific serine/threonine protein kinase n=1 Tax=Streptomyces lacrimifluminis TaxID=1500077 RepID=A0A917P0D4_9ACTN|nr:serine/threonine-protein kinase [Streptomyces lacrimifluminis]GGJ46142.1 serine/threonine protein kinase [Streptomyces lacrimifluminis]